MIQLLNLDVRPYRKIWHLVIDPESDRNGSHDVKTSPDLPEQDEGI